MASSNAAGNPHEVVNHTNASLPKITRNISNAGDVKDPFNILSFSFLLPLYFVEFPDLRVLSVIYRTLPLMNPSTASLAIHIDKGLQ